MAYIPDLIVVSGIGKDNLYSTCEKINENLEAISTEIENVRVSVVEWTNSVISKESSTPPVSPTEGDRYIVKATGSGAWASHDTEIAEYTDSVWVFTEPDIGTATVVDDEAIIYVFNGTSWVASEGAPHELSHLSGGTDEIDGDKLDIDYTAVNFTPTTESGITTSATQLTSFIKGLDLFAGTKAAASGLASLDASSKVVQNPANATSTPTASKIPIADGSAKLDGWITTPILATEKAAASGVASLDVSSKVVQEPASKAQASGIASLDVSSKVVQDPANATATPTASKIPIADGSGKLVAGWGGAASTLATLNSSSLVVENPANATSTQAIAKIPISDADGTVDDWVTTPLYDVYPDQLELDFTPLWYTNTPSPSSVTAAQLASHLQGIDNALKSILARLDAHSI